MISLYEDVSFLDERAVKEYKIPNILLMEHAAIALYREIKNRYKNCSVLIVSGSGNNGADGLALARILKTKNYKVKVFVPFGPGSELGIAHYDILQKIGVKFVDEVSECDVLVDALFGSGFARTLDLKSKNIIDNMNQIKAFKIACDIPSGIKKNGDFELCFKSDITVSMGAGKISLFNDKAKDFVGEIVISDLGLPKTIYCCQSEYYLLEDSDLKLPYRKQKDSHKGDYGHMSVIMGEKEGAAILAAKAGLRFGAGLVTIVTKENISIPIEIMKSKKMPKTVNVAVLGMGLGERYIDEEIEEMINNIPCVIDADVFSHSFIKTILDSREDLILTPHPKEFAALLKQIGLEDINVDDVQQKRFELAKKFSDKYPNIVLVLKGANTIIAYKKSLYINPFGKSNLAKGGSGDVLAGLIGSLLAQNYSPLDAAISATLAHSFAANRFKGNDYSLTPLDLIDEVCKL